MKAVIIGEPNQNLDKLMDRFGYTSQDYKVVGLDVERAKQHSPKFVMLIGAPALKLIEPKAKITQMRGRFFEKGGVQYLPVLSPGILFREPDKLPIIEADFKLFRKTVKNGAVASEKVGNYRLVKDLNDLEECIADLRKQTTKISYDLETNGLNPFLAESKIVVIGIGTVDTQWVVPMGHRESPFRRPQSMQLVMEMLGDALQDKELVGHNSKFDSLWTKVRHGVTLNFTHDTMLAHFLLDENSRHGLKFLASLEFGVADYDISTEGKKGHVSLDKVARYCALDVYYTRRLSNVFLKRLKKDPALYRVYKHLLVPASNVYRDIEYNGIHVHLDKMEDARKYLQERIDSIFLQLSEYKTGINWGSTKQLARYLYEELGLPIIEYTKGKAPSCSESVLLRLRDKHPVPQLILDYREVTKQMSGFINGWTEKMINSRLHPGFKLHGAVTGRTSCVEPNLQQTPRDKRIRSLLGAPEGWTMVEFDQSQVELRVAAMLSGDKVMKMLFQTNQDIHSETARLVSGLKELTKEDRKKAKAVNFGFLYGMGWKKFIEYARDKYGVHFTEAQAKALRKRFFEKYAGLPLWHERQRRVAHNNGYVRSLCGRIRHLPDIYSDDDKFCSQAERQAINSPVQGLASDFILMAVIELSKIFDVSYCKMVGTVHDAILFEVRNDKLEEVMPIIKRVMEAPALLKTLNVNLTVPLIAEGTIGNWGSGVEWHLEAA